MRIKRITKDMKYFSLFLFLFRFVLFSFNLKHALVILPSESAQGIEISTIDDYLRNNQNFILSMIIFPSGLIGAVVIWDKRK